MVRRRPFQSPDKKLGQLVRLEIGQGDLGDSGILEEIVGAGAALQSGTENQQFHYRNPGEGKEKSPGS